MLLLKIAFLDLKNKKSPAAAGDFCLCKKEKAAVDRLIRRVYNIVILDNCKRTDCMKKFAFVFLAAIMLFSFSACKKEPLQKIPQEEPISSEEKNPDCEQKETYIEENYIQPEDDLKDYITEEDGKLYGSLHPIKGNMQNGGEEICKNELVDFSLSIPEGWKAYTLDNGEDIYSVYFKMPWDSVHEANVTVYKDEGTTYDDFLANHSLWVGINEHTYHEITGNFSKGSYIRFDYPTSEKYDREEGAVSVYGRFYQLQFEEYVVVAHIYIRIDSEENKLYDEKVCDEFVSSIIIY